MTKQKLAIVIPAYKDNYLKEALNSIANQTCQSFTVYIGDDNSPHDLYPIIKLFEHKLNVVYKKFDSNLGGSDLVAQWSRCIDITQGEEWIWLFSDDDTMDENCVNEFYKYISANTTAELLHFNVEIINENGKIHVDNNSFPDVLSAAEFFKKRITYKINSFVVEYIFKRELYMREYGFKNFDLAWCADDATWIKFARTTGIFTIQGPKVQWRNSGTNVSSILTNLGYVNRKLVAAANYINWVESFFLQYQIPVYLSKNKKIRWVLGSVDNAAAFDLSTKASVATATLKHMGASYNKDVKIRLYAYFRVWSSGFYKFVSAFVRSSTN